MLIQLIFSVFWCILPLVQGRGEQAGPIRFLDPLQDTEISWYMPMQSPLPDVPIFFKQVLLSIGDFQKRTLR